jgi:hypothetical protein
MISLLGADDTDSCLSYSIYSRLEEAMGASFSTRLGRQGTCEIRLGAAAGPRIVSEAWQVTGTIYGGVNEEAAEKQRLT